MPPFDYPRLNSAPLRFLGRALWLLLLILGSAPQSGAHPNLQNAMWVQFSPQSVRVSLQVSLAELNAASQGALSELAGGGPATPENLAKLAVAASAHEPYLLQHLRLTVDSRTLEGKVQKLTAPTKIADPEQTYFLCELEYELPKPSPKEVAFWHNMLAEWPYSPGTPWDISYIIRSKAAGSDDVQNWLLRNQTPALIPTSYQR